MEIKTKHKKFSNFTDLYTFMIDSHLEEISVTMKYPDGTKNSSVMPIEMISSFTSIEQIKTLDKELKELATKHNEELDKVRELAENINDLNYFDDEEGEIQAQLDAIEASDELKQEIAQLVSEKLHAE